jgi:putative endonuclease
MSAAKQARARRLRALRSGRRGEFLCRWHLRLHGWRIVAAGWRCPSGEIDIIAQRRGVLAAIEVKFRADIDRAAEAILARQRRRIARAAAAFLLRRPDLADLSLRFDVMLVAPRHWPRHLPDAWHADF